MGNASDKRIYLDHAATTMIRPEVREVMLPAFSMFGNPSSVHREGQQARKCLEEARETIAVSIGANINEIFFTSGGTESDNWAIKGVVNTAGNSKRHIITSAIEHPAVLESCRQLEKKGFSLTVLPVDRCGQVNPDSLAKALTPDTALVSIMLANNEIGTVEPIPELATIAHKHGALFHTDAVQAVGMIPVDVDTLGVDLLSFSAHKFYGPKGIGGLYVRKGTSITSFMNGGAQEFAHRAGTENLPGAIGMAKALELSISEMNETEPRIRGLRELLIREITSNYPTALVNGDTDKHLPGIVNLTFPGKDGEKLLLMLNYYGFACSGGAACSSRYSAVSHVLTAIGLSEREAKSSLRISLGRTNTEEDIRNLIPVLVELLNS